MNRLSIRGQFLRWLLRVARVPDGAIPPAWLRVASFALMPSRLLSYIALRQRYDPMSDALILRNGARVSIRFLDSLLCGSTPTCWFRVIDNRNGSILIESRTS